MEEQKGYAIVLSVRPEQNFESHATLDVTATTYEDSRLTSTFKNCRACVEELPLGQARFLFFKK